MATGVVRQVIGTVVDVEFPAASCRTSSTPSISRWTTIAGS